MKKFLQKSYAWLVALVAMCAMSTSAMAEETVSYTLTQEYITTHGYNNFKEGAITAYVATMYWDGTFELYGNGTEASTYGIITLTPDDGYAITSVTINGGNYVYEANYAGSMTYTNSGAKWTGESTNKLVFTSSEDDLCGTVVVTYETSSAPPSTTFAFGSSAPSDGDVYTAAFTGGLTLNYNTKLAFAEGKSVADITVNGTAMDASTYVLFNPTQTWISYTFSTDGDNTIVIPAGVFVNTAGKTNEEYTINFTINLPYFTMGAAQWTTFTNPSGSWKMPQGYEGYIASDIVDGYVVLTKKFEAGDAVLTGYPVIINGPAAEKVAIESASAYEGESQFLYGNSTESATTYYASNMWFYMSKVAECDDYENCYVYKLSFDSNGENLGFYWDSTDGKSIVCQPGKAFLVVPASKLPAASSNSLKVRFAEDEVTGINSAVATDSNATIYNLQGQRVNATKAGVYVKNGKKFIVK